MTNSSSSKVFHWLRRSTIRGIITSTIACALAWQSVHAADPQWWITRGVLIPDKAPDDFAVLTQGQLKHFVAQAVAELNAELPGGAGPVLNQMVRNWRATSSADDYAAVTASQLKHLGGLVAERIRSEGGWVNSPGTTVLGDDLDDVVVNIGQAKAVFSFHTEDLDLDHDGIPTSVELLNGTDPKLGNFPLPPIPAAGGARALGSPPPQAAGDGSSDSDSDGKLDFEDAVSYDPNFDHAPMAPPSYAIVELGTLGLSDGYFVSMTNKGKILWQKRSLGTGGGEYERWDIDAPSDTARFTIDQNAISPGGGANNVLSPLSLREDGKIMGYTQDRRDPPEPDHVILRLASLTPGNGANWEPEFENPETHEQTSAPSFYSDQRLRLGFEDRLVGAFRLQTNCKEGEGQNQRFFSNYWWQFFEWHDGSLEQIRTRKAFEDGWSYSYQSGPGSRFGHVLEIQKTKTSNNAYLREWEFFLQSDSELSFLSETRNNTSSVFINATSVSHFENPWVAVYSYDSAKPPASRTASHVYKPDGMGGGQKCQIYAGPEYYPSAPLTGVSWCNPDRQYLVDSNSGVHLWANGELSSLADLGNTSDSYTSWRLHGMTADGSICRSATKGGTKVMALWMPVDFGIAPEEIVVAADAGELAVPVYFEGIDPHVLGARARFTVIDGPGSLAVSEVEFERDEPDQEVILRPATTVGSTCRIKAEITQLKVGNPETPEAGQWMTASLTSTSGLITVGPGDAANIQFAGANALPADGTSYTTISAQVTDAFGNPVAEGTTVNWRLKGDGKLENETLETDDSGTATATLTSGRVPGLDQTVIVEADTIRTEYPVSNTTLAVTLAAGPAQSQQGTAGTIKTFTVTATANAANGTPVRWRTSQGNISPGSSTLDGGTASATVSVLTPAVAGVGPVVVTVGVAESSAITSVEITDPITVLLAEGEVLVRDQSTCATIKAPAMVGQQAEVEALLVTEHKVVLAAPSGSIIQPSPPPTWLFSYRDYAAEVVWQRPADPMQSPMVLLQHGSFSLSVGVDGLPQLAVDGEAGSTALSITDTACAPAPGGISSIRLFHSHDGTLSLSCGGQTVHGFYGGQLNQQTLTLPYVGSFALNTVAVIPTASSPHIQYASVSGFQVLGDTPVFGPCGEPPPPPLLPALYPLISAPSTGWRQPIRLAVYPPVSAVVPSNGEIQVAMTPPLLPWYKTAVILRATVGSVTKEVEWPLVVVAPAPSGTPPPPDAPADAGAVASASADLYENVQYDNRPATPQEIQELRRYAGSNAALAADSGFTAHLEELAPPAPGGDLAHQAQQGRSFLEMAAQINNAISEINEVAQRMDQLTITGEEKGKHLFQMNTAGLLRRAIGQGSGSVEQWLSDGWDNLGDRLLSIGDVALTATVNSFQSTMSWTHTQLVAAKLDNVPLLADADKLAQQLTEEGLVDYVKALARLTATIAKNPQAAALHLITELESLVKPKLNEWAAAGGEDEKVAAAGAGMLAYGVQTGAMMASSACDTAAVRRMVAQALGTVISAALGSQEAKDELEEMIPFWSWLVMGEQVADLWEAADYYGSGKRTGELVVQIIGDFTILVPVVKGAQIAIKAVNGVTRASVKQALTKAGSVFTRKKQKPVEGASEGITRCFKTNECFPGDTLVLMADGTWCRIDQVRENDLVMADNPFDSSPAAPQPVHGVVKHLTEQLHEIRVQSASYGSAGGTVRATAEHPFWVDGKGWVAAADLRSGMQLVTPQHETVTVTGVEAQATFCTTWNLSVGGDHSYYVKAAGLPVLVHNTNPGPRVFIVYEVKLPNGKYYVGRASIAWDGQLNVKKAAQDALVRRFGRHHRQKVKDVWRNNREAVDILWHGGAKTGPGTPEYEKVYATCRGQEHLNEKYWRDQGLSINTQRPISEQKLQTPKGQKYLSEGRQNGFEFCAGRY